MKLRTRTRTRTLALLSGALLLPLASCGGGGSSSNPLSTGGGSTSTGTAANDMIVVGSADFPESQLIAAIYAQAMQAKGVKVEVKPPIGSREVYLKALEDGSIDLVPEYTGALALYYDKSAKIDDPDAVFAKLPSLIPSQFTVLDKSAAEDKDSIAVTKATADKWQLKAIPDLVAHSKNMVLGAPPEFQKRPQGVPGLEKTYGVSFKSFRSLKAAQLSNALKNGQVDAANIFTTDPSIAVDGFVVLDDPKGLFGAQNVVPLMTKAKAGDSVKAALNAVSAKLDTASLTQMRKEVEIDHKDPDTVAKEFLSKAGLS